MPYLLDTNVCVDYLSGRYPEVVARMQGASPDELRLSSIVVAELRYGADRSQHPRANHARLDALIAEIECLDFDQRAARVYGRVRAGLEANGTPIGPNDMLIAAHTLSRQLVLVTDNVTEFRRVKGLKLENWRSKP
jgi:tRNA(fMet)-specific endonuclease VapC